QVTREELPPAPKAAEEAGGYDMFAGSPSPAPETAPQSTSEPAPEPAPAPTPTPQAPAPGDETVSGSTVSVDWSNAFLVQIGAFQELETAEDAWNAARRRFADIMQDKAANIRQVEIPGRGTWYRVRIGPYDSRQAAEVACTDLKERGQDCLVATP
ncbi:MAG: SPOR domain-containing protein, partial [Alphaproteobacteria bacterium]|nr:SPOR domain-containing protein [Alphaproteobacteria bacterium]